MSPAATRARIRVEETVSPSTSTSGTTRVSNADWAANMAGSPLALAPKRKFSPTETRLTPKGMISFGSAAGCSTSSGWGSKVSTVSAPSITAWWPLCTPSKVPIATWRGRGSASGSDVTWIFAITRFPSSHRLHGRRHQLRDPLQVDLLAGVLDPEGADGGATQLGAVGVLEGLYQAADVGAGGAFDLIAGVLGAAVEQLGTVNLNLALGSLDHLAAMRLAVEALAADPHRRGHRHPLQHRARRQLERCGETARLGQLSLGVARAGAPAEPRAGDIGLRQRHQEALQAGGAIDQDQQQAGGEGVESAGVADLAAPLAAHGGDHVVRGLSRRLVAEQQ